MDLHLNCKDNISVSVSRQTVQNESIVLNIALENDADCKELEIPYKSNTVAKVVNQTDWSLSY